MFRSLRRNLLLMKMCLAFVTVFPVSFAQAQSMQVVKAGIPAHYEAFLALYAADQKGYFAEEGIKVEILTFKGGGAAGQAFVSGGIDLLLASLDHAVKMQEKGLDAVAIGGMTEYHAYALIAKQGRSGGGVAGLRGRKIGITTPGSASDIAIRYELKRAGLDAKDVTLISIGGATAMRAALQNDQIDAGMMLGANLVDMQNEGGWDVIVDFRKRRYPLEVIVARRAWLNENPEKARGFVRAVARAARLLTQDPQFAYEMTKFMFPKMSDRTLRGVSKAGVDRLSPDGSISREGVAAVMEEQLFAGLIRQAIPYEKLIDQSFMPDRKGR